MVVDKQKLKTLLLEINRIKLFSKIKSTKDFDAVVDILKLLFDRFSVAKGEKGATPQKGIDYWTDSEINQIVKQITNSIRVPVDGQTPTKEELRQLIKPLIPKPIKGDKGDTVTNQIIETIIEKTPIVTVKEVAVADTPEVIVSKLESLEDNERLPIKAIDKLQEELDKLKKHIDSKVFFTGGGGGSRRKTTKYDLSPYLNGVLKTFSIPTFWDIVSIHTGGSIPTTFRPITDYTDDAGASTITFTSEINEATTLAAGQTILVVYNEP